jgi:hypothetical protein
MIGPAVDQQTSRMGMMTSVNRPLSRFFQDRVFPSVDRREAQRSERDQQLKEGSGVVSAFLFCSEERSKPPLAPPYSQRRSRPSPGGENPFLGSGMRHKGWMRILGAIAVWLVVSGASAQEANGGPCDKPADKKILKLLADAAKEKNPTERHGLLKSTQEIDPECTECLFQLGMSAFGRARAGAGSYDAGINYLEQVKTKCPNYHSDLHYALGIMYYAKDDFPQSAQALQKFLKFPTDDAIKLSADIDAKTADVADAGARVLCGVLQGSTALHTERAARREHQCR